MSVSLWATLQVTAGLSTSAAWAKSKMEDPDNKATEKPLTLRQVMPMRKVKHAESKEIPSIRIWPSTVALTCFFLIVISWSFLALLN